MDVMSIMTLLGGLALFLYGMQMMSNGLEAAAGNKMKQILEKLTANRFIGVLVGAGITAIIQSSSATTVMVVGFVNTGLMTLKQAVWIIMGANIGTTITGQLIALNVGELAPLFAFIGVAIVVFFKNPKLHNYGLILAGLGVLFIGMETMGEAMYPLRESEEFISLMTRFSNPLIGILVGTLFTALIQSSSASVGILQTLAMGGLVGLPSAAYVLFGTNIGTCITAVLASIGTERNAKRTTVIHLMFNIFGTILFTAICMTLPLTELIESITPDNPSAQIANMHTLFNIVTTLVLLPFGHYLVKIAEKILPDREEELKNVKKLLYIQPKGHFKESIVGSSAIAVEGIRKEMIRMAKFALENLDRGFICLKNAEDTYAKEMEWNEEYIDYLNKEISDYLSVMIVKELNEEDSKKLGACFKICSDLERIGDHAMNLVEYAAGLNRYGACLSAKAIEEVEEMEKVAKESMELLISMQEEFSYDLFTRISAAEQKIDDMTEYYRQNQIERIKTGVCSNESCVLYSEVLTDFERVGDHILNIGEGLLKMKNA